MDAAAFSSAKIKLSSKMLEDHLKHDASDSNIAALMSLSPSLTLENLFSRWKTYEYILGTNFYSILIRDLLDRICGFVSDDVYRGLASTKGIVGIWRQSTIGAIAKGVIKVVVAKDTGRVAIVVAQPGFNETTTEEKIISATEAHMFVDEYTPANLVCNIIDAAQRMVVNTCTTHMKTMYPTVLMYSKVAPLELRLTDGFAETIRQRLESAGYGQATLYDTNPPKYTADAAAEFAEMVGAAFTMLLPVYVGGSGLGPNVASDVIENSNIVAKYESPSRGDALYDAMIHFQLAPTTVEHNNPNLCAPVSFTIREILTVVFDTESRSKGAVERFGKRLRGFIMALTSYIIAMYLSTENAETDNGTGEESPVELDPER